MSPLSALTNLVEADVMMPPYAAARHEVATTRLSTEADRADALRFLAARPLDTVNLRGLIRDNGLESPLNRGRFYGCRNAAGELEGVALIGHATLIEARTEAALAAFARLAQTCPHIHMVLGERESVRSFWRHYAPTGQSLRLAGRELLCDLRWPVVAREPVPGLRQATLADLDLILPVQAEMAYEESGVNPLLVDPDGFRARCARRIERGRVWVWIEEERLIFKTDIMAETPETIYVEGIYVHPEARGRGYGLRCLAQLSRMLLERAQSVCLLVNEENHEAQAFYQRAGYKVRGHYDTIFLQQPA